MRHPPQPTTAPRSAEPRSAEGPKPPPKGRGPLPSPARRPAEALAEEGVPDAPFARELRAWRARRGLAQRELAERAGTTPRHLSFLETGRSRPGAALVLRLARALELPLRQRNHLLRAAGHPPAFPDRGLSAAQMGPFRAVIAQLLSRHEPFPAYVIDARWRLLQCNAGGQWLWDLVGPAAHEGNALLAMLRAPAVWGALENRAEVAHQLADALERDALTSGDPGLMADHAALLALLADTPRPREAEGAPPVLCPRLRLGGHTLSTITTICRFGNALDLSLDELRVELVFPADAETEALLRALGAGPPSE